MEIKGGERRGLMVVMPAAPHYQGQSHQEQLRFEAFEIATRVFCQRRIYRFQNLSGDVRGDQASFLVLSSCHQSAAPPSRIGAARPQMLLPGWSGLLGS